MSETINYSNTDKAKSATFVSGLPDLNAKNRKGKAPLPILISCRIRLREDQRQLLKGAYNALRNQHIPKAQSMPGSTVSSTAVVNPDAMLGLSSIVMADILGSRESIPLDTILKIQKVLGVEAVTKDEVLKACESYCTWMFEERFDND